MKTIKEIIQERMKERGISVKQLCSDVGITEQTLYQIYRKNTANPNTLNKINTYLDLNLNKLFSIVAPEQKEEVSNNYENMIIDYLRKENDFLKGFIKEKLAINFSGGGLMPTYGTAFFGANNP